MMKLIRSWFDRLNGEPLPVVKVPGSLVLEPNPRVRQAVVKAELLKMDRRNMDRMLELMYEHYLADMSLSVRSRAEGEPVRVLSEIEAPLAVIRGMAALLSELDEEVKTADEPKKGTLTYG